MKLLHILIAFAAIATSAFCGEMVTLDKFVGSYYRGNHLGYNVTLTLHSDGRYHAEWTGCLGVYGTAKGSWKIADEKLVLVPSEETGMMKGHLGVLRIRFKDDRFSLLPEEDATGEDNEEKTEGIAFRKFAEEKKG